MENGVHSANRQIGQDQTTLGKFLTEFVSSTWENFDRVGVVLRAMTDVVIVDGVRTPHGTLLGSLGEVEPTTLGRRILDGLLKRNEIDSSLIEWVAMGNAIQAGIGQVPTRQAIVESQLPTGTPGTTINEASGSGLRAITLAADRINSGRNDIAIAGGFESMSQAPWILPGYRQGKRHGHVTLQDSMILDSLWDVNLDIHMGEITERLVDRHDDIYDLSRERQDRYALESHRLADEAIRSGTFDPEIVPVETDDGLFERDEGPRPDSTLEDMGKLSSSFRSDGTITAANASKLADGSGGVLLSSETTAKDHGLEPMCRLVEYAVTYRKPDEFNEAVGDVIESLLQTCEVEVADIDAYWINEAFAAQSVYVMDRLGIDRERMNPRGGAIAFGHPIGASGGMLATSLAHQFDQEDIEYGLLGMSIGGGGAIMSLWSR